MTPGCALAADDCHDDQERNAATPALATSAAELDASYEAYDETPLASADEWGDLASFRDAAARS